MKWRKTKKRWGKYVVVAIFLLMSSCFLSLQFPEAAEAATGNIYGKVIDGSTGRGIPYPYATVELYGSDDSYIKGTMVDDDGDYSFQGLAPGSYKLFACPAVYSPEKIYSCEWYNDKFRRDKADLIVVQSSNTRIDISLYGRGSISGRVTSLQEPGGVKDVYVYAYDPYYRLKGRGITDAQGRYRIDDLYAGQYKVRFDAQRAGRNYHDAWHKSAGRFEDAGLVAVDWERDSAGVDANLQIAPAKEERMKAVVIYGSDSGDFVESGDLWEAQYLESRNLRVERLYSEVDPWFDLCPDWDVLADIFEGAKIITYSGHGIYYGELPDCRVGGFYAMGYFFGYPELSTIDFAENPVVAFSGACFTAGGHSAPVSTTDKEETIFVAKYANDFMGWERGDYYEENSWRIDYSQPNLGFALYYAGYGFSDLFQKLFSNQDYRLDELIDEDTTEDPYRYNNESDPANPMKEDYRMLLPDPVGSVALVGNMNLTTKDIIPLMPPPDPPYGYDRYLYFAEGCTRIGFQEYLTLGNQDAEEAGVQIIYLFPDGNWQEQKLTIPAGSRTTIDVNTAIGGDKDVSVRIASNKAIAAERPMYFCYNGLTGGHDVMGAPSPSSTWYFAEGYTGAGFDEWICVLNPGGEQANLTMRFQTQEAGEIVREGLVVPAYSRATFKANDLLGGSYQTSLAILSTQPVVAERPMYFDYSGTGSWHWSGGHCVMGAPALSNQYLFAEGTTRGGFEEWITLQNPGDAPIEVHATYQLGAGQGENMERTYTVGAKSRRTVYVPAEVGQEKDVSVRLTSASPFLAERPMYFLYTGYGAYYTGGHCVIGAAVPASSWLLAEGCTRAGFHEWLCLQNPGEEEAVVEITYLTQEAGSLPPRQWRVPARSRITIRVNGDAGPDYQLSTRLNVLSGPPIVVERPMYFSWNGWDGGHDVVGYTP